MDCFGAAAKCSDAHDRARGRALRGWGAGLALAVWVAGGLAGGVASSARASLVRALSLAELVAQADRVAVVIPGERQARRHVDGKLIVTDVSLQVVDPVKGGDRAGATLVATLLGGTLDGLALKVPGEASLPAGQRLLVFLRRYERSGDLRVVGMAQGVLPVQAESGAFVVLPAGGQAELVEPDANGQLQPAAAAVTTKVPLTDLLRRIRSLLPPSAR